MDTNKVNGCKSQGKKKESLTSDKVISLNSSVGDSNVLADSKHHTANTIGYFDFLIKNRNRIVEDTIVINLNSLQLNKLIDSLSSFGGDSNGVSIRLKIDKDNSSMYYKDGVSIQDFIIRLDEVTSILDEDKEVKLDYDGTGKLVFDWS